MNAKQRRKIARKWILAIDDVNYRAKCRVLGHNYLAHLLNDAARDLPFNLYSIVRKALLIRIANGDAILAEIIKADVEADRRKYDNRYP